MIQKTCDLVVMGGGGSGMVAAVKAAQAGAKVIILERAKSTGGSMVGASTMRTFGSKWQKERDLPDVTASFARSVMDLTYWRLDSRLVYNALMATGQFFDWFCELEPGAGDKFRIGRYVFDHEDGPLGPQMGGHNQPGGGGKGGGAPGGPPPEGGEGGPGGPPPEGGEGGPGPGGEGGGMPPRQMGSGQYFMKTLAEKCADYDVEILTSTRVTDVQTEDGKLSAVLAEGPDGPVEIACKALVIAAGSWISNRAVVDRIYPKFNEADMERSGHCSPNSTGDGIALAEKLGAKIDYDSFVFRFMGPMASTRNRVLSQVTGTPYCYLVNNQTRRIACEGIEGRMGIFEAGHVQADQPKSLSYFIMDMNNIRACYKAIGEGKEFENNNSQHYSPPSFIEPEVVEAQLAALKSDGKAFKADTLRELAQQMGLDADALEAGIAKYNADCAAGFDTCCFKDPEYLVPLEQGPFFGVKGTLGTDGAFGGVPVDPNMRAYAEKGGIVEGLYVTGDFASGRFINQGGVKKQVLNDMSWALASGYLAGQDAARYLGKA